MAGATPTIACNLTAIQAEDRPRYWQLMNRLRAAIRDRLALTNGYAFLFDSTHISLVETAEWMSMERLCCPFLTLELSVAGNHALSRLSLTGPPGVKALLETEFPLADNHGDKER